MRPRTTLAGCRLRGRHRTGKAGRQGRNGEGQGGKYAFHCFLSVAIAPAGGVLEWMRLPCQRSPGFAAEFRRLHSLVGVAAEKVQRCARLLARAQPAGPTRATADTQIEKRRQGCKCAQADKRLRRHRSRVRTSGAIEHPGWYLQRSIRFRPIQRAAENNALRLVDRSVHAAC